MMVVTESDEGVCGGNAAAVLTISIRSSTGTGASAPVPAVSKERRSNEKCPVDLP